MRPTVFAHSTKGGGHVLDHRIPGMETRVTLGVEAIGCRVGASWGRRP